MLWDTHILPRLGAVPMFVIAGAALLLLFVGIHNAWDSVTYLSMSRRRGKDEADAPAEPAPKSE